jgi:predicted permease
MLRKQPIITFIVALTVALGVGANTAVFSAINAILLRRLPVLNPEQLVAFRTVDATRLRASDESYGYPTFKQWRGLTQVFSDVAAVSLLDRYNVTINASGGVGFNDAGPVRVALASGNYFSLLGVGAVVGRPLTVDDDRMPGGHPVAVISHDYWTSRFARADDVVGHTLALSGATYTIVGVMPPGFAGHWTGRPVDLWIPTMMQAQVMPEMPGLLTKSNGWLQVLGRLKPGVSVPQAQAAAHATYQQAERAAAGANATPQLLQALTRFRLELISAAGGFTPQREAFQRSLTLLMLVAGVVLLITCANIANLLLARGAGRRREIAMRMALGAGRARVVRQLLTESLLLTALGGALGLLFAVWGTAALSTTVATGPAQMDARNPSPWLSLDLQPDLRVFAFTVVLCLLTGLLSGLAPAFLSSRVSLSSALTERGVGGQGGRFGPGKGLVIAQVALSLMLLVGAGLLARSLRNLKSVDIGVNRRQALLVWTAPGQTGRQGAALANLVQTVQQRIAALPGVVSAGASNQGVLNGVTGGGDSELTRIEGRAPKPGLLMSRSLVTPGFFASAGLRLIAGRDFTERDLAMAETLPVTIVNETWARFFFGQENPVGKRIGGPGDMGYSTEIIGVVKDTKMGSLRETRGVEYAPSRTLRTMCLAVRAAGNPALLANRIRQELREVDANLPVLRIATVEEQLNDVLAQERLLTTLASVFAALAVLLSCLGMYGVISHTVARRTPEIGVRLALGATPGGVMRLALKESLWLLLAGIAIGAPATLATTRLLASFLFGVGGADPLTFAGAALLLTGVALLACCIPARRAAKVDPLVALRCE